MTRKEREGRIASAALGVSLPVVSAGAAALALAMPAGLMGATLIGAWLTFVGGLGTVVFASMLHEAFTKSAGGNFQRKPFLKGLFASAVVMGGVLLGMQGDLREAFNRQAVNNGAVNDQAGTHQPQAADLGRTPCVLPAVPKP